MQMLPNYILPTFFKSLHSMICKLVWKRPRLKLESPSSTALLIGQNIKYIGL